MRARLVLLIAMTAAMTGCHGGLHVPDDWMEVDAAPASSSRMQVILCYGPVLSNHAVLRLESSDNDVVFWDPGGMYGPAANRRRDLVLVDPPTAQGFWVFRRDATGEIFHLVFEWDLPPEAAAAKRQVLLEGTTFKTGRAGGGCSKAICEFFQLYATELADVPKRWLLPHDLANHLWTQPVDRVRVFAKGQKPRVYVRRPKE